MDHFGHGRYDAEWIPIWEVYLCQYCFGGNRRDGIVMSFPDRKEFADKLRAKGVTLRFNEQGCLIIPK